jgi:hypothetical protein
VYIQRNGLPPAKQFMTLHIEPEIGVPIAADTPYEDLKERAEAACNTAEELAEHGLDIEPTREDKDVAAKLAVAYADDPETTSKKVTTKHLVTNKLLLESENDDPRIRIRALELLGKISDVGLFAEKSEVTITHQSTDDLRAKLRSKLEKLVNPEEDIEDAVVIDTSPVDVKAALAELDDEYDD